MSAFGTRLRTILAIGLANSVRVAAYRLRLKLGLHPAQRIRADLPVAGPFFNPPPSRAFSLAAPRLWQDEGLLFGTYPIAIGATPPPWTLDPLSDAGESDPSPGGLAPWWRIDDFANGDIKRIWELSRFDWAISFAQQARAGNADALLRLNDWISDWARANPAYRGPNWKCAQEASIRLLHLAVAALILGEANSLSEPLRELLLALVKRITPTLSYARAQDNNHATSEAAALFVAGAWLTAAGLAIGPPLERKGRALLERSTNRLFAPDGSFSQYSLNYHRLALDTLSIAEIWRRRTGLPPFSPTWRARARAASDWLRIFIDPVSGGAPNLGANDGANLLPLTDAAYGDYRPSAQLAAALFQDARAFPVGPWDDALEWLGVAAPPAVLSLPDRAIFPDGGYALLRSGQAMAMFRFPRYRFRPSQADALHVDLWLNGENLLRDGGSFSYNSGTEWIDYFGGVRSHNTVQFDGRPQMPRLSRFLLGDWLKTETSVLLDGGFAASYRHRAGWSHRREVRLNDFLQVADIVGGFTKEARLRWRLAPGDWRITGTTLTDGRHRLTVCADVPIVSMELATGWESRRYLEKTEIPVLEVAISRPGTITTEYHWIP